MKAPREVINQANRSPRVGYDGWGLAWRHSRELVDTNTYRTRAEAREARRDRVGLFPNALPIDPVKVRVTVERIDTIQESADG